MADAPRIVAWPQLWWAWAARSAVDLQTDGYAGDSTSVWVSTWPIRYWPQRPFPPAADAPEPPPPTTVEAGLWQPSGLQWKGYAPQPWLGWQQAQDQTPPAAVADATSTLVVVWPQRFWPSRPSLTPNDPFVAPPPPTADVGLWQPPALQWKGFRLQPWLGWMQAQDQPPLDFSEAYAVQWNSAYRRQPWLGWTPATDVPPPPTTGDATATLVVVWMSRYWPRPFPSLIANDPGAPPDLHTALSTTPRVIQWREWTRQPQHGWARAFDETAPVVPSEGVFIPVIRRRRR